MHGDADKLIDPTASRELHTIIASSTLTIYPGMGHSLPRSLWPDIVAEIRHVSAHNRDHHQPGHSQPPAETRSGGPAHPR